MTKIHVLYCWSPINSTAITLYIDIMIIDLWSLENWCKLKSIGSWDYCGIQQKYFGFNSYSGACMRFIFFYHSPSLHIWQLAREFFHQDLLEYFYKTVCGRGRSLLLLSDSSPVSFFPGEINLKILFADWPSSSDCQLLQMRYQTEVYKITMGFSST